jgi:hypothetical protein
MLSLDLRRALGRRCRKMLAKAAAAATPAADRLAADYWPAYLQEYIVTAPSAAADADAAICAHGDVWQQVGAAAGRAMDGYALLQHIDQGGNRRHRGAGVTPQAGSTGAAAARVAQIVVSNAGSGARPVAMVGSSTGSPAPRRVRVAGFHRGGSTTQGIWRYSIDRDRQRSDNAPGAAGAGGNTFIRRRLSFPACRIRAGGVEGGRRLRRVTPDTMTSASSCCTGSGRCMPTTGSCSRTRCVGSIATVKGPP